MLFTRNMLKTKDSYCMLKGGEKTYQINTNQKKPDKMEFQGKSIIRDKDADYPLIKKMIPQEDISILTLVTPKNIIAKYTKQRLTELPCEIDKSAITMGNVSTSPNN